MCRATLDHVSPYCDHTTHYPQPKINGPMSLLTHLERDPLFEKKKIFYIFNKHAFLWYYVYALAGNSIYAVRCLSDLGKKKVFL